LDNTVSLDGLDKETTLRNIALWLHILGAGTWLGANIVQGMVGSRMTAGDAATSTRWLEAVNKMSGRLYGAASAAILLTGVYLVVANDRYSFGSVFVGVGFVVLLIGGALAGLVFTPQTKKAIALFAAEKKAEGAALMNRIGLVGIVDTVLVAVAVLAMVAKWGA
jgi:uncharacterized membrane protein